MIGTMNNLKLLVFDNAATIVYCVNSDQCSKQIKL